MGRKKAADAYPSPYSVSVKKKYKKNTTFSTGSVPQRRLMHVCVTASGKADLLLIGNRSETGSRSPRVSPHSCFVGGVKFPQGEGSAVIHREKNDLLHKAATYMSVSHPPARRRKQAQEFTLNRKQVKNRLKIPQGLSTLMYRRWSEVPSGGGDRGDTP